MYCYLRVAVVKSNELRRFADYGDLPESIKQLILHGADPTAVITNGIYKGKTVMEIVEDPTFQKERDVIAEAMQDLQERVFLYSYITISYCMWPQQS